MTLLAPTWLLALLPWAAFAVWTWMGRRRRRWVPFLALWNAPQELRQPKKGVEPPPVGLILALLAMLLGIVGMAQPVRSGGDRGRVTIVVDRGASMSATVNGKPRFAELANAVGPEVVRRLGLGSVDLIDVVDGHTYETDRSNWWGLMAGWKRTALDTAELLKATVRQRLERGEPVIVLSDQDLGITNAQLVQVKPDAAVQNAGILALADRPGQVMVTLRASDATARRLRVRSGDRVVEKDVNLKPGVDQNVFVDLDAPADTIEASLAGRDDFDGDDRAWLVRGRSWPVIEPRTALPDELRRMVEIYGKHRPPSETSPRLALGRPGELKGEEPGVVVAPTDAPESPRGEVGAAAHPVVAGVDWAAVSRGVAVAVRSPGEGWTKLAWLGDRAIVAVREGDARQVWVGFESRDFSRTPGFVILWTNIFDWAGGGGAAEGFHASEVGPELKGARRLAPEPLSVDIDRAFWPGLFETAQARVAANTGAVTFATAPNPQLDGLSHLKLNNSGTVPLAPWLALAAIACLLGSAAVWARKRPTPSPIAVRGIA